MLLFKQSEGMGIEIDLAMNVSSDGAVRHKTELEALAAQLAHDFNNLLTAILGNLELLQLRAARTGESGGASYVEAARQATLRAAELSQRLFVFSGHAAEAAEHVPLDAFLQKFAADSEAQGVAAGELAAGINVFISPGELSAALQELLRNAAEAGAEHIELTAAVQDDDVVIMLRDDGRGMTPEILARARELLFTSHANAAGRGLGLGIAERVAARAGGRLELTSQPGLGCEVRLILPVPLKNAQL